MSAESNNLPECFYAPIHFTRDYLSRLLLLAFHKKDPDPIYSGFEPQLVTDPSTGVESIVLIGYRHDKYLDVYHQPSIKLDIEKYRKVHNGAKGLYVRDFEDGYFRRNGAGGVEFFLAFRDAEGRDISIRVSNQPKPSVGAIQMLAPVGSSATHPNEMMMVFMDDFYFISQKRGMISIVIDGKQHRMKKIYGPTLGGAIYTAKYSLNPMIVNMCTERDEPLPLVQINGQRARFLDGDYQLSIEDGKVLTKSITCHFPNQDMICSFLPALPDIRAMREGDTFGGDFLIDMGEHLGNIGGDYRYECGADGIIKISIHPSQGWKLGRKNNSNAFKVISSLIKVFKAWPKSYQWDATLTPTDSGYHIVSGWKRI